MDVIIDNDDMPNSSNGPVLACSNERPLACDPSSDDSALSMRSRAPLDTQTQTDKRAAKALALRPGSSGTYRLDSSTKMSRPLVACVALAGFGKLFESCINTQRAYSERHSYDYLLIDHLSHPVMPAEASWLKIAILIRALDKGRPWIATFDADCEVRPQTPRLESLEVQGKSLYMATGFSGRLNAGVIIASNHDDSKALFARVLAHADNRVPADCRAPYENGHIIYFATGHRSLHVLEHALWNNNSKLSGDSYIQHYTGPLRTHFLEAHGTRPEDASGFSQHIRDWSRVTLSTKLEARLWEDVAEFDSFL